MRSAPVQQFAGAVVIRVDETRTDLVTGDFAMSARYPFRGHQWPSVAEAVDQPLLDYALLIWNTFASVLP